MATKVQDKIGDIGGNGSQVTVTFDSTPTQNNGLIAMATRRNTGTLTMNSSGWTEIVQIETANFGHMAFWGKVAGASESTSVVVDLDTDTSNCILAIAEYSGWETTTPWDVNASDVGSEPTVTSRSTGTTATTSQANQTWVGVISIRQEDTTAEESWSQSFVQQDEHHASAGDAQSLHWSAKEVSSTGAAETTMSWTTAARAGGIIVTFNHSAGGPAANPKGPLGGVVLAGPLGGPI